MILLEPEVKLEPFNGIEIMKKLERACRICYRSESLITEDSYKKLLKNCINRGHESVLEHASITAYLTCDVGCYKDLTRHRHASFSVESTRYCNYSKDKFEKQIKFIKPCNIDEDSDLFTFWKHSMERLELNYIHMADHKATPDQMRMILPHSTTAEVVMTANIREWRHVLSLRASAMAHPSVQQVMIPLLLEFKRTMPELFDNIDYNTKFDTNKYAKLSYIDCN